MGPDRWFAAAARRGLVPELEAATLRAGLASWPCGWMCLVVKCRMWKTTNSSSAMPPHRIVREAQVAASNLRPASLDATTADGDRPALELVHTASDPALDEGIVVRTAIGRLPARDQRLIALRFDDDLTQAEIASRMGLSAMQVSRLLRRVLGDLRRDLGADGITARSS